jgi:uncharacterized protein (UPF0332 family)
MDWKDIAISNLACAKSAIAEHPRSSASRAYYAAHVALALKLTANGYVPPPGRQTQPHREQPGLIRRHLTGLGANRQKRLAASFVRMYARRIDADYKRTVKVVKTDALELLRDASAAMRALGVSPL